MDCPATTGRVPEEGIALDNRLAAAAEKPASIGGRIGDQGVARQDCAVSVAGDAATVEGIRGASAARAYCQSRDFAKASSHRRVDPDEVTGSVPKTGANCSHGHCDEYVAITCQR